MSKSKHPKKHQNKKPQPNIQVKILAIRKYKDADIMVQNHGNMFQYIIFWRGNFYTSYNEILGAYKFSNRELEQGGDLCLDQAIATIETLIHKDNPDELLKKHEQGAAIMDVLEKNNVAQS